MRPAGRWQCFHRKTRAERVADRRKILLWDAAITKKTQERYFIGVQKLLPYLGGVTTGRALDERVSDWIQKAWEEGEALHIISDALCGLQHYEPWTKNKLALSWRLFKVWRKVEAPNRAPPLTAEIVDAFLFYAIAHRNLSFAAMICLGFYGLLRTGELLQIRPCDMILGNKSGVISLKNTKTGLRNAAQETVSITNVVALEILRAASEDQQAQGMHKVPIWVRSPSSFRNEFRYHCQIFDVLKLNFRPYSLRRGGATALFQQTGSMETALLKGRWQSTKVAKIYLADGLSYLPGLSFSAKARSMLKQWSCSEQLKTP